MTSKENNVMSLLYVVMRRKYEYYMHTQMDTVYMLLKYRHNVRGIQTNSKKTGPRKHHMHTTPITTECT